MNNFQLFVILSLGDNIMTIYDRIKSLRISQKMSQTDLALKLGYKDGSMITKIESGKVDISQKKIIAFAKALNTTPGYLMGWTDDHPDDPLQPANDDVRLLIRGLNKLSPEQLEQATNMMKIMFAKYADYFEMENNDDS